MKKKLILLGIIVSASTYSTDDFFYEESEKNGVKLKESVISTTGFETTQRDITNKVTVITSKEIEEKNYQTVTEVLKDVASINVIGDPRNPIIDMRGQGDKASSNVQVMVDGVSANYLDNSHMKTPINTLSVDNIEKIEVIPGGGAILYGSGTRGGIINIITKSGAGYNGGSIGGEFTSFGGKKGEVKYGKSFGRFGFNIGYVRDEYKGYRDFDEGKSDYLESSLSYKISENQNLSFKYLRFDSDSTIPKMLTKEQLENPKKSYGEADIFNNKKDEYVLKYENKIDKNLNLSVVAFYQDNEALLLQKYSPTFISQMNIEEDKYGIKPKLKICYRESDEVVLGYDYINDKMKRKSSVGKSRYLNDFTKETHSIFALNKNSIGKVELTQGVRYEYAKYDIYRKESSSINEKKDENNLAVEFVANYLYSDTGNIYGKIERGFTSPAPNQMTDKINGQYVGNSLKSENYLTYELGAKDYLFGSFITGAIYLTDTDDEITSEILGHSDLKNYNIGKTRRYGIELSAEQYFGKITLRESYSYVNTKILKDQDKQVEGKEIANVPNHKVSLGLDYEIISQLKLNLSTVYSSGYYLNNENVGGKQNSHIVTNISLNYYPIKELKLYVGVNNLFNDRYYNAISSDGTEFDPASERSFIAGIKYNF